LATCFFSSEPPLGQFFVYGHGTFSECEHYGDPTLFIKRFYFKIQVKTLLVDISFKIYVKSPLSTLVICIKIYAGSYTLRVELKLLSNGRLTRNIYKLAQILIWIYQCTDRCFTYILKDISANTALN
jgi:hypothetical protein